MAPSVPFFTSLQGLRFIAAMMVVYHHTAGRVNLIHTGERDIFPGFGGAGVDIFFVISGFVISQSVLGNSSIRRFLVNRAWRIVPLYWVLTLAAFALVSLAPFFYYGPDRVDYLLKSLFFLPANRFGDGDTAPLIAQGWTLNFEMLFYLLFAISMFAGKFRELACTVLIALVFAGAWMIRDTTIEGYFYTSHLGIGIIFEFCLGLWLAVIFRKLEFPTHILLGLALMAAGFAVMAVFFRDETLPTRFFHGGLAGLAIVTGALLSEPFWKGERLGRAWRTSLHAGGDISYAIYLSHIFVVTPLTRVLLDHKDWIRATLQPWMTQLIFLVAVIVLGAALHYLLDAPLQAGRKRLRRMSGMAATGRPVRAEAVGEV